MEDLPSPNDDERYTALLSSLRTLHGVLRKRDYNNPSDLLTIKDDLGQLRLSANLLFSFLNQYIDVLTELEQHSAIKRQTEYEKGIKDGMSPNASELHSRNITRIDEARVKTIENRINQIKNEYERYNTIAMYLQSRLKEAQSERMLG